MTRLLARLLPARTPAVRRPAPTPIPAWAAYGAFALIYAVGFGHSIYTIAAAGGPSRIPAPAEGEVLAAALPGYIKHGLLLIYAPVVVWAVTRATGLRWRDIGIAPAWSRTTDVREPRPHRQAWAVFIWALAGYLASQFAGSAVSALTGGAADGGFSLGTQGEAIRTVLMVAPATVASGITEEILVVAVPVVLLTAARRPTWEILTVTMAAKLAYHLYYGLQILPLLGAAALMVWLYRRTGRLTPVILAHVVYNQLFTLSVLATLPGLPE